MPEVLEHIFFQSLVVGLSNHGPFFSINIFPYTDVDDASFAIEESHNSLEEGFIEHSIKRVFIIFVLLGDSFRFVDDLVEVEVRAAAKILGSHSRIINLPHVIS